MRASFILFFLFSYFISVGQDSSGENLQFRYDGMDAKISRIREDNMYFGSISTSYFTYESYQFYLPVLFAISGEFGKRIAYMGDFGSISLNVAPHIGVSHLFAGKISGTANFNFFNYSNYDNTNYFGLLGGGGYEMLFSTFQNSGVYPIARGGILFDNFRLVYQHALAEKSNSKYTLIFSSKLDW